MQNKNMGRRNGVQKSRVFGDRCFFLNRFRNYGQHNTIGIVFSVSVMTIFSPVGKIKCGMEEIHAFFYKKVRISFIDKYFLKKSIDLLLKSFLRLS